MHHGQTREKRKTHKVAYVKKHVNFMKSGGNLKEYKEGNNNFPETGEKCTETGKRRGKIQNCESMTKKGHQKFWRGKIEIFVGKGEIGKIFHRV